MAMTDRRAALALERFEYTRLGSTWGLARLTVCLGEPDGPRPALALAVDHGGPAGRLLPAGTSQTEHRLGAAGELLWRGAFAMPQSVFEDPTAIFSLRVDGRHAMMLPAPLPGRVALGPLALHVARERAPIGRIPRRTAMTTVATLAAGLPFAATASASPGARSHPAARSQAASSTPDIHRIATLVTTAQTRHRGRLPAATVTRLKQSGASAATAAAPAATSGTTPAASPTTAEKSAHPTQPTHRTRPAHRRSAGTGSSHTGSSRKGTSATWSTGASGWAGVGAAESTSASPGSVAHHRHPHRHAHTTQPSFPVHHTRTKTAGHRASAHRRHHAPAASSAPVTYTGTQRADHRTAAQRHRAEQQRAIRRAAAIARAAVRREEAARRSAARRALAARAARTAHRRREQTERRRALAARRRVLAARAAARRAVTSTTAGTGRSHSISPLPGFKGPASWTGIVSANPGLSATVGNLSGLASAYDRPPSFLIPIYMQAAHRYRVPWQVLAAINSIETDYGMDLSTSSAGAIGWMQFEPGTWKEYGVAADGVSEPNPYDPRDAIFAAARYLRANGGQQNIRSAVFAYNHAGWYVDEVMARATAIASHAQYERASVSRDGEISVDFATAVKARPLVRFSGGTMSHYDRLIAAANMVSAADFPYLWGGGHEQPARFGPFDCSGSVSYVMQQAGYALPTTVSGNVSGWHLPAGPGRVTIFYNPTHTFMRIGDRYFGTSGFARPGGGAGWFDVDRLPVSYLSGFHEVHVPDLGVDSFSAGTEPAFAQTAFARIAREAQARLRARARERGAARLLAETRLSELATRMLTDVHIGGSAEDQLAMREMFERLLDRAERLLRQSDRA